jgi:intracellular multiplication protein IcmJ
MYKLKLTINLSGWCAFVNRATDASFVSIAKKISNRDNNTCQFCGFQAKQFQSIVNLDGNYFNNQETNLVTACCFCTQCLFFQAVGLDNNSGGQLIYLPEFSQAALNSFVHVLFVAMGNQTAMHEIANTLYRNLRFRSQVIENKFGPGASDPVLMAQMMLEYAEIHRDFSFTNLIKDLRLLPIYQKFSLQLNAWAKEAAQELAAQKK